MDLAEITAALNRAVLNGDQEEVNRLQTLRYGTPDPHWKPLQQQMDELLGEEQSLEALRAQFPGCSDDALEDWQLIYRAWLFKTLRGIDAGPMPPSSPCWRD